MSAASLSFEPFQALHLAQFRDCPAAAEWWASIRKHPVIAELYEIPRLSYTLFCDERPVAAAGIRPMFAPSLPAGQGECWSLFTPATPPRAWPEILRRGQLVVSAAKAMGYRRLESYVRAGNCFGFSLADRWGFTVEAEMQRWGPEDCTTLLMAWTAPKLDLPRTARRAAIGTEG